MYFFIYRTADTINEWDRNHIKSSGQRAQESNNKDDGWHKIIDRGQFCMWRKPVPNSYLFEYKGSDSICISNMYLTNDFMRRVQINALWLIEMVYNDLVISITIVLLTTVILLVYILFGIIF